MTYRDWHVGMKVVCVDNSTWEHRLKLNGVYTIAAIDTAHFDDRLYIGLVETPSKNILQWLASRFRPVQPRKTDISVFTRMLNKDKVPA
jgi:hypothetical protein